MQKSSSSSDSDVAFINTATGGLSWAQQYSKDGYCCNSQRRL